MPEPEANAPAPIQQTVTEARYAATSATGSAAIQIINYNYSGPLPPAPPPLPGAGPASEADRPCPYRGLFHFGPNDAAVFFGRDAVVDTLQRALERRAVLPLLGASGSGKSSVVFAGLVPRLAREGRWRCSQFRPGEEDPFQALALALVPLYAPNVDATEQLYQARQLANRLRKRELPLADVLSQVRRNGPQDRLLLIADQFEELYSPLLEEGERRTFLDVLLAGFAPGAAGFAGAVGSPVAGRTTRGSSPRQGARLLLTLRADFLGNALSHRPFADLFQQEGDGTAAVMLGPMTDTELREAIELRQATEPPVAAPPAAVAPPAPAAPVPAAPAASQGQAVPFESGLVERILRDVAAEPGHLPLLEFALTQLWSRRQGALITHAAYSDIGGVEGALARHADACFAALHSDEQLQARRVLLQLVRPGEGTEDTRRLATRQELGEARWTLARRLADDRLVVTSRNAAGDDTVEVVHEALIRHWGQLRAWLVDDRGFRAWQERLRGSLAQWRASGREEGALLRGAALAEARDKLQERPEELAAAEREFIAASAAAADAGRRRERRRRRLVFSGLSGGLALVSVALLLAWGQLVRAQRQRGEALAASAKLTVADGPVDSLVEALAAAGFSRYGQLRPAAALLPVRAVEALRDGEARQRERQRLQGHQGVVWSASYSGDGSRIVSAGDDGTLRVWDAKSGKGIGEPLRGHQGGVRSASYSGDGSRIVSAGADGTLRVWDAKSGKGIGEPLRGHQG
ncbi:MAG: AAA family ATPase, partial [Cyanobacteriota bacterium]|nr:AAA family ATPase [Cyanobacteriota bacterium]